MKVSKESLIFGNGTDELIELIAKAFLTPEDEIIVSEHAFIRYRMAGQLMGAKVTSVPMKNFTHDLVAMTAAISPRTKLVFIANPNNPTGTYATKKEVRNFIERVPKRILLIFDEAYYEYACSERGYPDTLKYLSRNKIIILRTFSKAYALAGLRLGYGISNPQIIEMLERVRPPFNVNLLAQEAAIASFADENWLKKSIHLVKSGKKYLYGELKKLNYEFIPSAANFILIKVNKPSHDVFKKMLNYGIIVRPMEEYDFPDYVRVTIGKKSENQHFIRTLKSLKLT